MMGNFPSVFAKNSLLYGYSVISKKSKWVLAYIILLFRKRKSRMYKYDMNISFEPVKAGFFIPHDEWDLECPSTDQENDEMLCVGVNSDGACLVVQIARESIYDSPALFLKINGHTYTLPVSLDYLRAGDRKTFGSNRLYMQCIAPFRKWKIFFNGLLREMDHGSEKDQFVHVRFSFIWVASSGVFDLASDYSIANMADILSKVKWDRLKPPFDWLFSLLNEYHQPGMLIGTVEIENVPSQEVVLWGCRCHSFNLHPGRSREGLSLFGNAENGFFFYFKVISFSVFTQRHISGYVMLPNGSLKAVRIISVKRIKRLHKTILFFKVKAGNKYYNISTFFYGYGQFFGRGIKESLSLSVVDVIVNGIWGGGVVVEKVNSKTNPYARQCHQLISFLRSDSVLGFAIDSLLVSFDDPVCLQKHLTGNVGSSIARLKQLGKKIPGCNVLDGLVITTLGGMEFYSSVEESISILKNHVLKNDTDQLENICDRIVAEVTNSYFPPEVYDSLIQTLKEMNGIEDANVCIYPSIHGPESEVQLLEAYLDKFTNVACLHKIMECIKKCWASQFSFGAVQCKKSTGQPLKIPLAVIVQKAIPFKTSGIITTCDPQTGNPSIMEIREGIDKLDFSKTNVLTLKRDINNNLNILKSNKEHEDSLDNNVVKGEIHLPDCQILFLGRLACKLEKHFQYPLCIEWCLNKTQIYVIQIRPITVLNAENKSDIIHHHDSFFRVEDEWLSVFNSGEAFLGPISPLGINILNFCIEGVIAKMKLNKSEMYPPSQVPYFPKFLVYTQYFMMYSLADGIYYFYRNFYDSFFKALSVILNFKSGGDEALLSFVFRRHGNGGVSFEMMYHLFKMLFFSGTHLKLLDEKINIYDLNLDQIRSAEDVLDIMSFHYQDLIMPFLCYIICTYKALFWNSVVFYILDKIRRGEKTHADLQRDFNVLISAVSSAEEGDIVLDIMAVSHRIENIIDPAVFKKLPAEDAKIWLEDAEIDEKVQFSEFLKKHGHRSQDEVDIFQKCWSMDPIKIVKVLQNIVPTPQYDFKSSTCPLDPLFSQLPGRPNPLQRLILKYAIPRCSKSLKEAKKAKSHLLKVTCVWKKAFYHLAHNAVKEFRIPFPEAMFFLTLEEIRQLMKARSPQLVTKALKCWAVFPELSRYVCPVMPILDLSPFCERYPSDKRLKVGLSLTGCPMSRGTAVGTAVVATKLDEITDLKKGSVLITYSPSIIWSLFFPILGGFAADVGGMLSDGAVAAREYGVPCVINLVIASQTLRTGDRVFIDGNAGLLRRLPPD